MGVIKKLQGNNLNNMSLVSDLDVYPITHIKAVYDDNDLELPTLLNNLENRLLSQINQITGGESGTEGLPINYLWAYTAALNDEAASALFITTDEHGQEINGRDTEADLPNTNFYSSTNFPTSDGEYIYMTCARKQGENYVRWEEDNDYVWSEIIRIGSGHNTSYIGADGEGVNYTYCRTATGTPPSVPSIDGNRMTVEDIEAASSNNKGISVEDGEETINTYNAWWDHPNGVTLTYPYEWIIVSTGHEDSWSAYTTPVLWSKYGQDGKDGDGVEYIYKLLQESDPVPVFGNDYSGKVTSLGETVIVHTTGDTEDTDYYKNSTAYQSDDFILENWYDLPQLTSSLFPRLYVSIRKKTWDNAKNNYIWGVFSSPVLWSEYSKIDQFSVLLSNEAFVIGTTISSSDILPQSCNILKVFNSGTDITKATNYIITVKVVPDGNIENYFKLVRAKLTGSSITIIDSEDQDYIENEGFYDTTNEFIYNLSDSAIQSYLDSYNLTFCLNKINLNLVIPAQPFQINYIVSLYLNDDIGLQSPIAEITTTQTILCVDTGGILVRVRGEWKQNTYYCYKSKDMTAPSSIEDTSEILYIDVVQYDGHYYLCKESHTSTQDNRPTATNAKWLSADLYEFIYTKVLVADEAAIEVLNGGSIAVHNNQGGIVAGMRGGTGGTTNNVIIWGGGPSYNDASTKFKLYEDGTIDTEGNIKVRSAKKDNGQTYIIGGITGGRTTSTTADTIIWAGDTRSNGTAYNPETAPFQVKEDGSFSFADGGMLWKPADKGGTGNNKYNRLTIGESEYEGREGKVTVGYNLEEIESKDPSGGTDPAPVIYTSCPFIEAQASKTSINAQNNIETNKISTIKEIAGSETHTTFNCRSIWSSKNTLTLIPTATLASSFQVETDITTTGNPNTQVTISSSNVITNSSASAYANIILSTLRSEGTYGSSGYTPQIMLNSNNGLRIMTDTNDSLLSDIRLKDIHKDFQLSLDLLSSAPLFEFRFKGDTESHIGTSAQYWQKLIPTAVREGSANEQLNVEKTLMLDYTNVAFASAISLAKEVKKLKEEIEELKLLIADIKGITGSMIPLR